MDVDSALALIGGYKKWHMALFVVISIGLYLPICLNTLVLIFIGWTPKYVCNSDNILRRENVNNNSQTDLFTHLDNVTISSDDIMLLKCHKFHPIGNKNGSIFNQSFIMSSEQACEKGWKYDNDGYMTITQEWNLVCDQNYLIELSQVIFQFGCLIGDLTLSYLTDLYGRRSIFLISQGLCLIIGVATSFVSSFLVFTICRGFLGIASSGAITSAKMLVLEIFDSKHRTLPGIGGQLFWTFGHLCLGGICYYVKNWRNVQLIISLGSAVFFVLCYIFPESPMWLVTKGNVKKSEKILRNMAKLNGVQLDPCKKLLTVVKIIQDTNKTQNFEKCVFSQNGGLDIAVQNTEFEFKVQLPEYFESQQSLNKLKTPESHPTAIDLFTNFLLLKYMILSSMLWFSTTFVMLGLTFTTPSLAGNRFLNYMIMGVSELPSPITAMYLSESLGRRRTTMLLQMATGIFVSVVAILNIYTIDEDITRWTSIVFLILAKFTSCASFSVAILYTKEFFPTSCRATCTGVCQVLGRVGAQAASLMTYLAKIQIMWGPYALFGLTSILVGILVHLLPETKGITLPETIEDCHKLKYKKTEK